MTLYEFVDAIRSYCLALDGSVTSWGRTVQHNAEVGGVANSQHLDWAACDVVYDVSVSLDEATSVGEALGLVVFREGDHDHVMVPRPRVP